MMTVLMYRDLHWMISRRRNKTPLRTAPIFLLSAVKYFPHHSYRRGKRTVEQNHASSHGDNGEIRRFVTEKGVVVLICVIKEDLTVTCELGKSTLNDDVLSKTHLKHSNLLLLVRNLLVKQHLDRSSLESRTLRRKRLILFNDEGGRKEKISLLIFLAIPMQEC